MSKKLPYMAFYTGDWLKDTNLSLCSPATRGVWIDLLCRMHESGRVGSLAGAKDKLAQLARCTPAELVLALDDLRTTGAADVTERNGVVTVINRRMDRDAKKREANKLRQAKHRGNGSVTPLWSLYEIENEDEFYSEFPEIVRSMDFRKSLNDWLNYKNAREENYEQIGLRTLVTRAANLATKHGLPAVIDAMQRAIANNWAGWDHANTFTSRLASQQTSQRPRAIRGIGDEPA